MNKTVRFLSLIGIVFGIVTIISGGSVLSGASPGYVVFLPLVVFNTLMGFAYILTGIVAWRNPVRSKTMAGIIFLFNLGALVTISYLYWMGSDIADQSLGAILFRSIVWLIIYIGISRVVSKHSSLLNEDA